MKRHNAAVKRLIAVLFVLLTLMCFVVALLPHTHETDSVQSSYEQACPLCVIVELSRKLIFAFLIIVSFSLALFSLEGKRLACDIVKDKYTIVRLKVKLSC